MKLSTKLIAGFAAVAVITAITGAIGFFGISRAITGLEEVGRVRMPSVQGLLMMAEGQAAAGMAMRTLTISELSIDKRKAQYDMQSKYLDKAKKGLAIYEPLPQTAEEAKMWSQFKPLWEKWRAELDKAVANSRKFDEMKISDAMELRYSIKSLLLEHFNWAQSLVESIAQKKEFKGQLDATQCNFGKWYFSYKPENPDLQKAFDEIEYPHNNLHALGKRAVELMAAGKYAEASGLIPEVRKASHSVEEQMEKIHEIAGVADELMLVNQTQVLGPVADTFRESNALLEKLVELNVTLANDAFSSADSNARLSEVTMIVAVIISVILAMTLGVWLARSISKPIMGIVEELGEGSTQVNAAAGEISSASQSLAEGSTEQASSLEETSSALEEITSMTSQNADNANHANSLAKETRGEAEKGAVAMNEMIEAMSAINKSSEEISKIIKVIEEIAFQTNLLALNAAVEAARAGEHGKGFAVVAEEVRNLAQRSATAAKDTASLIEDAVKKAANGGDIANRAGQTLTGIVESVKKVTDLVAEIAAASNEQAQGVGQVSTAVSQMDKVTQQNAANAEETAAASEELSAQAETLNSIVGKLTGLVEGTASKSAGKAPSAVKHTAAKKLKALPGHVAHTAPKGAARHTAEPAKPKPEGKPEHLIPLDDDFKDF